MLHWRGRLRQKHASRHPFTDTSALSKHSSMTKGPMSTCKICLVRQPSTQHRPMGTRKSYKVEQVQKCKRFLICTFTEPLYVVLSKALPTAIPQELLFWFHGTTIFRDFKKAVRIVIHASSFWGIDLALVLSRANVSPRGWIIPSSCLPLATRA